MSIFVPESFVFRILAFTDGNFFGVSFGFLPVSKSLFSCFGERDLRISFLDLGVLLMSNVLIS